ncbi:MAG: hypothetical protein KAH56_14185, partial [Candidatus Krumholzibacteria bacterium]|nr:hypothetical protein [Candidatus Krumholzibacteria bacterium]
GVLVDGGVTQVPEKLSPHDFAEPQHGTLMGIIHDDQRTLERNVDFGGGLIGDKGNFRHDNPPESGVLGGAINIRTKDERNKKKQRKRGLFLQTAETRPNTTKTTPRGVIEASKALKMNTLLL